MKIKVTAFGVARDIIGDSITELVFEDNSVLVTTLKEELNRQFPGLERLKEYFIAVNENYASNDLSIKSQDEVVIIPPVSGG